MTTKDVSSGENREIDVQSKLYGIIRDLIEGKRFDGELDVRMEYPVDNKRIDIAVFLKPSLIPILIIETKRKDSTRSPGLDPLGEPAIGQALCYAALAKEKFNLPVTPFFATANRDKLVLFSPVERPEEFIDMERCRERDYGNALRPGAYVALIESHSVYIKKTLKSEDIQAVLEDVAKTWIKILEAYKPELLDEELRRFRWPLGMWLIDHLRTQFIDYLSEYFVAEYLKYKLAKDKNYYDELDRLAKEAGYKNGLADIVGKELENVKSLARMMLYVLLNKIVFYKVLERHYKLTRLKPLLPAGVKTSTEYLEKLGERFKEALEATRDFEAIFITGLFDKLALPDEEEALRVIDTTIELLDNVQIEEFGDVIGHVYEELIPPEERHQLGQFYTPPSIAELIVRWAVRTPGDVVLDPGSGSGTFLVEAYKRLFELKTGRKYGESLPSGDVHEKILSQLYGLDINPFAAQLTAMNLAMRNVKVPSTNINIIVRDFFTIRPNQELVAPYKIMTPAGEIEKKIVIPAVDAVIGNPPYTRWDEIPESTKNEIKKILKNLNQKMKKLEDSKKNKENSKIYKFLSSFGSVRAAQNPGIYIFWIIHATDFIKNGGRLGMIIPNVWLQTDYGIDFSKFLLDNFKIKAIIDFSQRLFRIPLVSTLVLLMEKCANTEKEKCADEERMNNDVRFIFVEKEASVSELLDAVNKGIGKEGIRVITIKQKELPRDETWIRYLILPYGEIEKYLKNLTVEANEIFDINRGNVTWFMEKLAGSGADPFFFLTTSRVVNTKLEKYIGICIYPALTSSRYSKYFTFTREDWEQLKKEDKECFMFICHKPLYELPDEIKDYIKWGQRECRVSEKRGRGLLCSQTVASRDRARTRGFYGWYDLGEVKYAPIFAIYQARYKTRFIKCEFPVAMYHALIAFIPKVELSEKQLKALLAYLNSSFTQYYVETNGRYIAKGPIGLEVNIAEKMPILDVRKLPEDKVEKLAKLFDELESEARRIGGASEKEQIEKLKPKIYEIDRAIAEILGIGMDVVEEVERAVDIYVERRISGAKTPAPDSVRGSEEPRRTRRGRESGPSTTLDSFM